MMAFDTQVGLEDTELVAAVQRGIDSRMLEPGRLVPSERLLRTFQRYVRDTVEPALPQAR